MHPLSCATCDHAEAQHRPDGARRCRVPDCHCPGMRCPHPAIAIDGEGAWCLVCGAVPSDEEEG